MFSFASTAVCVVGSLSKVSRRPSKAVSSATHYDSLGGRVRFQRIQAI